MNIGKFDPDNIEYCKTCYYNADKACPSDVPCGMVSIPELAKDERVIEAVLEELKRNCPSEATKCTNCLFDKEFNEDCCPHGWNTAAIAKRLSKD